MQGIAIRWVVLTVAITAASYLMDGIAVSSFGSLLAAAAILGILNALFRPVLILLTLPLTVLTFGIFILVINALLLMMASVVVSGFHVDGFGSAFWGSLVIGIISWVLNSFVTDKGRIRFVEYEYRKPPRP
jgi:putative membrane protein